MAHIYQKYKETQDDKSTNKKFVVEWFDIEAEFVINENDQGWEILSIETFVGDKDEVREIVEEYMQNEYEFN